MNRPIVIFVTGPSGAGKTMIANRLRDDLAMPIIAKDSIKEVLFDVLGQREREWSSQLSRASFMLLYYFLESQVETGHGCIVDANFSATVAFSALAAIQQRHLFVSIQLMCRAPLEVRAQRLKQRIASAERHLGHVGDAADMELELMDVEERDKPLGIDEHLIVIDTSSLTNDQYADVLAQVRSLAVCV